MLVEGVELGEGSKDASLQVENRVQGGKDGKIAQENLSGEGLAYD